MGNEKQAEGVIAFVGGSSSGKTTIAKDTAFFGNFKIVAQRYYNTIHKDFFDTLDKKERQRILQTVFGTNKPVIYNPDEHYAKLSIDPADV